MIFKIGDRVREIGRDCYKEEPIVIINSSFSGSSWRYHLKYLNVFNVQGTNMLFWVSENEIVIDTEYYRNKKLEDIGV